MVPALLYSLTKMKLDCYLPSTFQSPFTIKKATLIYHLLSSFTIKKATLPWYCLPHSALLWQKLRMSEVSRLLFSLIIQRWFWNYAQMVWWCACIHCVSILLIVSQNNDVCINNTMAMYHHGWRLLQTKVPRVGWWWFWLQKLQDRRNELNWTWGRGEWKQ